MAGGVCDQRGTVLSEDEGLAWKDSGVVVSVA